MANTIASISLTSLDPDTLLASFKTFMQSQPVYKDYDYEGSAMTALLRIMAHNTFLNSFYLNMLAAEAIGIDTAQTRSALISHAKELNYTPRSAYSAIANVSFTFMGTEPAYVINKGQTFSTTIRNNSLNFSVPDNILLTSTNGMFNLTTSVYEGVYLSDSYVVNYSDETQRFVLSNPIVDTRSITVVVYEDGNTQGTKFNQKTTLLGLNENSKVWFLGATETEKYEISFGDNVVGYRPKDGALVVIDYRVTTGSAGNGARVFSPNFSPTAQDGTVGTTTKFHVTLNAESADGIDQESEESIRYKAPRAFQVQERAATADDYAILLQTQFPEIQAISAYGGELLNPPRYGKVVVAISIQGVDGLPQSKIDEYTSFLQGKSMLTKSPLFIVPEFTYVQIQSAVTYNINITTVTPQNIQALVVSRITTFDTDLLNNFNSTLRYSRFVSAIDESDTSILGNETDLQIYKKLNPILSTPINLNINFDMPLYDSNQEVNLIHPNTETHTITSTPFIYNGDTVWLDDDGVGGVYIRRNVGTNSEFIRKVGTIDYATGAIQLTSFQIDKYNGTYFKVYAKTLEKDIISDKATILSIEADEILINVTAVRE
jgi:hypothetical protein